MKNFKHYIRKNNRLKNYNYATPAWYFITICTKDKTNWFGKIKNNNLYLNQSGKIVTQQWLWLSEQYHYVALDEFIIMPNHFHGILIIDPLYSVILNKEQTGHDLSLQRSKQKIKSVSELVGAFKTTSSKLIHQNRLNNFSWQRSFYDHIIRNEKSLCEIRQYIHYNVSKWESDRYYKIP